MTKKIIFTVISTFSMLLSFAQSELDYVKENTYYFEITKSNVFGEGADILKKSIEESQFFILGEQHFSAKVSEFTNAIVPILLKENYKYFVAEIGPYSANVISDIIKGKDSLSLYRFNSKVFDLVGEIPIPFFDGKEDEVFLKNALNNGMELWGIDQEYLTSQVFLIDEIYKLSKNKSELDEFYKQAKDSLIRKTKKYWNTNIHKLFTELSNSTIINQFFKNSESANINVQKIISDLRDSWEVYRLQGAGDFYSSTHKRVNILKTNFIDYYSKALKVDALPKSIIKIGGVHAAKGRSTDNIFDIGNFLMELANFNGQKSTSILVFPSAVIEENGSIKNNIDKEDEIFIRPLINEAKGKWVLIDLKRIEEYSWRNKIEYKSLKDYIQRFDYLILTPPSKETTLNFKH